MEANGKVGGMPDTATYTHGHAESVLRSHRTRTAENSAAYLLPHLRAGLSLLDIGSGPGTITVDLAERVAPGPVTAVEVTEAALRRYLRPAHRASRLRSCQKSRPLGSRNGSRG